MINDSNNNYGGAFSPYEDLGDTPDNDDKGVFVNSDPSESYNPERDDMSNKSGDGNDGEDYTLDNNYFAKNNTDISDITDIDSRKPTMSPAQKILDEKLNLVINGIRIIVDRLDKDAYAEGKQAMMNTTHPYAEDKHADGTINQIDVLYHNLQKANKKIKELQQKKEEI